MADFPIGFPELVDEGGHGQGLPLEGFGGNAAKDQAHHQAFIKSSGRAPLVLVHGNTGTATHPQWGWRKVVDYLKDTRGYADEHFWALSYLGSGERELLNPYTANIEDLRKFADAVRTYLGIDCIDMVGHSMGCHLILCYLAGLKKQGEPIVFDQGPRYAHVGSVILLDGAMRGLRASFDEWLPGHDVYDCIEPDHTPFGGGNAKTPAPAHNLKYWCCMVPGGFVDSMDLYQGTTGHLVGADENRNYNAGPGHAGHEKVKDDPPIIEDWAHYLNTVPPADPVFISVDKDSGNYIGPFAATISVDPPTATVDFTARRITKQIAVGVLETNVAETKAGALANGQELALANHGMWEVQFEAHGALDVNRTYGIDVMLPQVEIITDNAVDFGNSLTVMAQSDRGILYLNVGCSATQGWERRASVTITQSTKVQAIAITAEGIASAIVAKVFKKAVTWTEQAIGTVTEHYVAGRLDINAYLHYGSTYGYIQSFTLYLIDGGWTDDPEMASHDSVVPVLSCSHESGLYTEPLAVKLTAIDTADPAPRIYYSTDDATPTTSSDYFVNQGIVHFNAPGRKTLRYMARDRSGNTTPVESRQYALELSGPQPTISPDIQPGVYESAITVVIRSSGDTDEALTIHYTEDGSVPDENSPSFIDSKPFPISRNGNHAISCFAKDSTGNEHRAIFYYVIRDFSAPTTTIFPAGGEFSQSVEVSLSTEEPVEWIKYTTDGSDPHASNGLLYNQAFMLSETATIKFRSKDKQGNLEEVKSAHFSRQTEPHRVVFDNIAGVDGYIKADPDGTSRSVVDYINLAIGAGWDAKISRAIVSFDTSSLPPAANIVRACLQVRYNSGVGQPWQDRQLQIDVKSGKFGSASHCQTRDWDEPATAAGVATIAPFGSGLKDSSDFNAQGREAINCSGRTQMRLYFHPHADMQPNNYLFLSNGEDVKLIVEYTINS